MLGGGAWGTAVAKVLAENGYEVNLWCREPEVVHEISKHHINAQFLPGVKLSENIKPTTSLAGAVRGCDIIFEAVPVRFLRSIVSQIKADVKPDSVWVTLSKGIEQGTLLLPTMIIEDIFDSNSAVKTVVLSGPSFAKELVECQFTAVTLASKHAHDLKLVRGMLNNSYFHAVLFDDPIGVQVGGALKNVCALATGIIQGNGGKSNTAAYVLTRGLKELCILSEHLGGKQEALYELAGVGDLILTCTGTLSKNLKAGRLLAQHRNIEALKDHFAAIPEGVNTVESIYQLIKRDGLSLPLFEAVYEYIFKNGSFSALLCT